MKNVTLYTTVDHLQPLWTEETEEKKLEIKNKQMLNLRLAMLIQIFESCQTIVLFFMFLYHL